MIIVIIITLNKIVIIITVIIRRGISLKAEPPPRSHQRRQPSDFILVPAHLHHATAVQRYHVRWHICVNSWARESVLMTRQGQRTPLSFPLCVCVRFPFRSILSVLILFYWINNNNNNKNSLNKRTSRLTQRWWKASGWFNPGAMAKWTQSHAGRHCCGHSGQLLHANHVGDILWSGGGSSNVKES